jgi:hypothetical protein
MPRMFVEGIIGTNESPRMAAHILMKSLDEEAAKAGHRVTGDVQIFESDTTKPGATMRLEADVVPSV